MPDRTLVTEWPEYVNSTGVPGTGSKLTAELLDGIKDAVEAAVYDPSLEEDPPAIAREVTGARGAYGSLDARLDALEALASGGAAVAAVPGQVNLVPNGNFLIWSGGSSAAPTFFGTTGGPTIARQSARGGADSNKIPGPYYVNLTSGGAGNKDLYIDLISTTDLSTNGSFPLSGRKVSVGLFVKTSTSGSVTLVVDDGSEHNIVSNTHSDGTWAYISGTLTLATSASRLRLIVRLSAVITVGLAGLCAYLSDSADRYVPPPMIEGDILYAEPGGAVSTGEKAKWYPSRPVFVYKAYGICASGTGTIAVTKNGTPGTSLFATDVQVSSSPTEETAVDASVASLGTGDTITINVTASSSMTTPTLRLRYVAFANVWAGYFTAVPS